MTWRRRWAVNASVRMPTALAGLTLVLMVALDLLLGLGPSLVAHASVAGQRVRGPTAPVVGPRPALPAGSEGPGLRLDVDSLNPRVVTTTGPNVLSVAGWVHNIGDQPVRDVQIRAQLSQRLRTEGEIRTALAGNTQDNAVITGYTKLTPIMAPGAQVRVTLNVPLRGPAPGSLELQRSGVYQLLLTVNGSPVDGNETSAGGVRALLPVLGLPSGGSGRPASPQQPNTLAPRPVSVLYPLADQPRRLPTGPGEPVLLADDQLADELAKGGRLDGLLDGLETGAPVGSPVRAAICLAVDPDLLRTVADMSTGYQVRGPDGVTVAGRGAAAAKSWLDRLRAASAGRCIVALPFADTDLVALSRAGLSDLADYATVEGAKLTATLLGTPVRQDITWPADGLLDERSLNDYAKAGGHQVVLTANAVSGSSRSDSSGAVALATPDAVTTGLLTDPLITLAATGEDGANTFASTLTDSDERSGLGAGSSILTRSDLTSRANQGAGLAAQDAIGAIAFRSITPGRADHRGRPNQLLIAPPHQWNTGGADAQALLDTVNTLITQGRLSPMTLLTDTAGGAADAGPDSTSLVYPLRAGAREVPTEVTSQLRADRDITAALRSAAIPAQGAGTTPAQVFDPVTQGMLRGASTVWRGHPSMAAAATTIISDRVQLLRSLVRVVIPTTPYALGDQEAPLPLTLSNGLPVAMRVRVELSYLPGLRITSTTPDPAQHPIPPLGRLQLRANTQLTRSGTFTVEARLYTLGGAALGPASQLQLRSTVYGTITLWLTGTAGILLVILAVRRIVRRLRGSGANSGRSGGSDPVADAKPSPDRVPVPVGTPAATSSPTAHPVGRPTTPPIRQLHESSSDANTRDLTQDLTRGPAPRRPGTRPRDPVARRLGAAARAQDLAAIQRAQGHPLPPNSSPETAPISNQMNGSLPDQTRYRRPDRPLSNQQGPDSSRRIGWTPSAPRAITPPGPTRPPRRNPQQGRPNPDDPEPGSEPTMPVPPPTNR